MNELYRPLVGWDAIRLLELHPGLRDEPIECTLREARFARERPDYEAVSYVWAQEPGNHTIRCNGVPVQVTNNLYRALYQMRLQDAARSLWIDQLCVNQTDVSERSQQVSTMFVIFWRARRILVWLGAIAAVDAEILESLVRRDAADRLVVDTGPREALDCGQSAAGNRLDLTWSSIERVLALPWFRRAWTIQEGFAALQRGQLVLGRNLVDFGDFIRFKTDPCSATKRAIFLEPATPHDVEEAFRKLFKPAETMPLQLSKLVPSETPIAPLLQAMRSYNTTDDRDRVYSVWEFLEPSMRKNLGKPDYNESVEDLFHRVAMVCLQYHDTASFLGAAGLSQQKLAVPSWVPDWTFRSNMQPLWLLQSTARKRNTTLYRAGTVDKPYIEFSNRTRLTRLITKGMKVSRIQKLGPRPDSRGFWETVLGKSISQDWLASLLRFARRSQKYQDDWEGLRAVLNCLTCSVRLMEGALAEDQVAIRMSSEELDREVERLMSALVGSDESATGTHQLHPELAKCYAYDSSHRQTELLGSYRSPVAVIEQMSAGRQLFLSENGMLGLGSVGVHEGDLVAVLSGFGTPFILRMDEDMYNLVGECFVHGLMDSEAFHMDGIYTETLKFR